MGLSNLELKPEITHASYEEMQHVQLWGCTRALPAAHHAVLRQGRRTACDSHVLCAVATPGILFDWALPLLTPASTAAATDVGVQFAALSALRECLAAADDVTLARYATVVFDACQKLLEDERTVMQLLPPLLGVLTQARACYYAHIVDSSNIGIEVSSAETRSRCPVIA